MTPRTKTDMIVIHCASTPASMDIGVKEIKKWHIEDNKWDDIGYHYVIRRDGTLETGREEHRTGSHARQVNGTSLGVCLVGGYGSGGWENNFTEEQFSTLKDIVSKLKDKYNIEAEKIIGHYEVDDVKKWPSFDVKEWRENNGMV